jgi:hypothetical protein
MTTPLAVLGREGAHQVDGVQLVAGIQPRQRLVGQQPGRLARQHPGQQGAGPLAARQGGDVATRQAGHAGADQGGLDGGVVGVAKAARAAVRGAAQADQGLDVHRPGHLRRLGQEADPPGALAMRQGQDRLDRPATPGRRRAGAVRPGRPAGSTCPRRWGRRWR